MSRRWMGSRRAQPRRRVLHGAMIGVLASAALLVSGSVVQWGAAGGSLTPSAMLLGFIELFVVVAAALIAGYVLLVALPGRRRGRRAG